MKFDDKKSEKIAQHLLRMQFEMGGRGEDRKIDCYGVLKYFYAQFDIHLPDYSYRDDWNEKEELYLREYASFFRKLGADEPPEIGDMILFINTAEAANHAALYLGKGRFIHAYRNIGTKIDLLTHKFWKQKIHGFFRIKDAH